MKPRQYLLRYLLEFLVIVLGISLSFYLEKRNALEYQQDLKNQSLSRINKNLKVDLRDLDYNRKAHAIASESIDWIITNHPQYTRLSKDSLGKHLSNAITISTIFVDNQEEYRALQNSGLIELIELEEVVTALQNKYIYHEFYKKIEEESMVFVKDMRDYLYENTILTNDKSNELGFSEGRVFVGDENIPTPIIERLKDKKWFHDYYRKAIVNRMKKDSALIVLIEKEIH
jgi:hypothetical protein